jgi:Tfp pilus assembly protein PilN
MINLMPPNEKRQLRAARTNSLLLRYNFLLLGAMAFLGVAVTLTWVYLSTAKATAETTQAENDARVSTMRSIETDAQKLRANLSIAKQILNNEVTYTKVIFTIASLMPRGTVLDGLNLDSKTFGTPAPLVAKAATYETALALKDSLQSSPLFSDVHFQSITSNTGSQQLQYPLTVTFSVTLKKDAAK